MTVDPVRTWFSSRSVCCNEDKTASHAATVGLSHTLVMRECSFFFFFITLDPRVESCNNV